MKIDFTKFKKILDVGCGQHPLLQATHYCDAYPEENVERGADLNKEAIKGKDFKIANLDEGLPYADKEFDFVHCSHVLEHVNNPEFACKELMRVAKAGYIETPTPLWEILFGRKYHKWVVAIANGIVHFYPKPRECDNNFNGDKLYSEIPEFKKMFEENNFLFTNKFIWKDHFTYLVERNQKIKMSIKKETTKVVQMNEKFTKDLNDEINKSEAKITCNPKPGPTEIKFEYKGKAKVAEINLDKNVFESDESGKEIGQIIKMSVDNEIKRMKESNEAHK